MVTYEQSNFEQIAAAIGMEPRHIAKDKNLFEAAALWYRLNRRRPRRTSPSKMRDKLHEISKSARRLLTSLGVKSAAEAADGPGNSEVLAALIMVGDRNEDPVIAAVGRIGRLIEVVDGLAAAAEIEARANKAVNQVVEVGKLTVRKGNAGDDAINDWIGTMMELYRRITGREPATSVGAPERFNEGIAAGPLIRFLAEAGKPLGIEYSEDAWRSRVRTILKGALR